MTLKKYSQPMMLVTEVVNRQQCLGSSEIPATTSIPSYPILQTCSFRMACQGRNPGQRFPSEKSPERVEAAAKAPFLVYQDEMTNA